MNTKKINPLILLSTLVVILIVSSFIVKKNTEIKDSYVGQWSNASATLKVRTKNGFMDYTFTPITIPIQINIQKQGVAFCKIGDIELKNLKVQLNPGNTESKGIIYTIDCGMIGKLTSNDPLANKKIEFWIKPIKQANTLQIEVRQMHFMDPFPMGEINLKKH